ncbi:MAG: response regulator [Acidobacteriaceae bacterium]
MTSNTRILIADDHALFRDGLRRLLELESEFEVVGEASNTSGLIQMAQKLQPDLILLDLSMPQANGLEAVESLALQAPLARIIVLTAAISREQVVKAMQHGVRGIALKECTSQDLLRGIGLVLEGRYWFADECMNKLVEALREATSPEVRSRQPKDFGLTRRELEVVNLVVAGYSNPEIAKKCAISEQTVKHHMSNIFDKVGMYNRVELALFAVSHKIAGNV